MLETGKGGVTRRAFTIGSAIGGVLAAAPAMARAGGAGGSRANPQAGSILSGLREEHPIPAISGAVCRDGELIWQDAQGIADLELGVPVQPDHLFRLGSVSKVVTVAIGARLAEAGLIDLDTPISTYRPDLPEHHRATTLRQLYNHQGGVRHYSRDGDYDFSAPGGIIDVRFYSGTEDALALFINDPLIAEPGTSITYSSFGYTLISAVLESASGKSFLELIEDEVAKPLSLASLKADDWMTPVPGRVAYYDPSAMYGRVLPNVPDVPVILSMAVNTSYKWAAGGMVASAPDLARFGAAHLRDSYLRESTRNMLFTPRTEASERMPALGLGWRIDMHDILGRRFHHAGNMQGCRAQIALYPEHGLSVALMSNLGATPGNILAHTDQLAAIFAP